MSTGYHGMSLVFLKPLWLVTGSFLLASLAVLLSLTASARPRTGPYPIEGLGSCRDAKECFLYCEVPENQPACWSYGKYVLSPKVLGIAEERAGEEFGITFPIPELGGCADVAACAAYCEVPANHQACGDFAAAHGLGPYKEEHDMLVKAKEKFGCDSPESCRDFCGREEHWDQCIEFASQHAPPDVRGEFEKRARVIQEAQSVLGCNSFPSCKAVCENPSTRDACFKFIERELPDEAQHARRVSEKFLQRAREVAGCQSADECLILCDNPANRERCEALARSLAEHPIGDEREFLGDEGCRTEEQCRDYCARYPDRCPGSDTERFRKDMEQHQQKFEQRPYPHPAPSYAPGAYQGSGTGQPSGGTSQLSEGSYRSPERFPEWYSGGEGSYPGGTSSGESSGTYSGESSGGYSGGESGGYGY